MARRGRPDKRGAAFLVVWMTFWLAAILIAVWTMGAAALAGEPAAAIFLLVWVGAALFGLVSAARSLRALVLGERRAPRPNRHHRWNDGLEPAPPAAPAGARPSDSPPPPPADTPADTGRPS
jgi:hypothetical protein